MEDIEKSKEDLEREREEIIESAKERLATLLNMVFPKEYASESYLPPYLQQ